MQPQIRRRVTLVQIVVEASTRRKWIKEYLTHISLASHKKDIAKQCRPRSDAAERGFWSGSTLFASSSEIYTKHDNNKKQPDTLYIGNGPVQS